MSALGSLPPEDSRLLSDQRARAPGGGAAGSKGSGVRFGLRSMCFQFLVCLAERDTFFHSSRVSFPNLPFRLARPQSPPNLGHAGRRRAPRWGTRLETRRSGRRRDALGREGDDEGVGSPDQDLPGPLPLLISGAINRLSCYLSTHSLHLGGRGVHFGVK